MVQYLIVGLIVLVAALQVARKSMPAAWRRKLVYLLSGRKAGAQSKMVKWLDTDASCGSGCDTCKACETEPQPPAEGKHRVIKLRVER
ncbi:hypothetical protein GCM10027321_42890 [Massilia terrae]|uniref:FeoB-associated Cys-rich membrane protein n=1 Tax=Massilia terrae TaxID=1811224 RepID=A0ABT2D404_9BURK|nr:DUF6587 family protein [Massilia terrae]MCS0660973.1 hypothetical protein [Massilia terrae]